MIHDVEQYRPDWWALRLGRATASRFGSIITGSTMKPSEGRKSLITDLLLERRTGKPADYKEGQEQDPLHGFDRDGTPWMKRGADVEAEARIWYQMHTGRPVVQAGFVSTDDGLAGCSPDGLVMVNDLPAADLIEKGLEVKCRSARFHMRYVLGFEPLVEMPQVQGSMWVTGADAWDVLAYCPGLPSVLVHSYRDPAWTKAWGHAWKLYRDGMKDAEERLDRIEEDCVESDNLSTVFGHAIQKKPTRPCPLSLDELQGFRLAIERLLHLGHLDAADYLRIIEDIWSEDWESVEGMVSYCTRLLLSESTVTVVRS